MGLDEASGLVVLPKHRIKRGHGCDVVKISLVWVWKMKRTPIPGPPGHGVLHGVSRITSKGRPQERWPLVQGVLGVRPFLVVFGQNRFRPHFETQQQTW